MPGATAARCRAIAACSRNRRPPPMRPTAARPACSASCPGWWACSRRPRRSSCCSASARHWLAACCISTHWQCAFAKPVLRPIQAATCARRVYLSPATLTTRNSVPVESSDWERERMASSIRLFLLLTVLAMPALSGCARAESSCGTTNAAEGSYAARIANAACQENALWHSPFIDAGGRLASMTVSEVETAPLADGRTPAWTRVSAYWRGSGLMPEMASYPGADECGRATVKLYPSPACRAFLADHPWSAAFVSWVLVQARLPGFRPSTSHLPFVRDEWQRKANAYVLADPDRDVPAAGDLLCFIRGNGAPRGLAGLKAFLQANGSDGLPMHCDIV